MRLFQSVRFPILLLIYIFYICLVLFSSYKVYSADLTTAQIRLDRLAAQSPLSGLICITPASSATEGKLQVVFPSDFSISNTGWSVSTSNIPGGSTAWPGISFQLASGNTATFASSDLTQGTLYCFTFASSGSTTGNIGAKAGTLTTLTGSSTIIDSQGFGFTIGNDQVTVNGTVPASASDYSVHLEKTSPSGSIIRPQTHVEYKLSYSSSLSFTSNIQVVASWSQGTIGNSAVPSIDILSYATNTATDGYGGVKPVIDTLNRTITWNISALPGNLTQNVSFQLITLNSYSGSENVAFTVSGKVVGIGVESLSSSVTSYYSLSAPLETPAITPTQTPSSYTPTIVNSQQKRTEISSINISSLSSDNAIINADFSDNVHSTIQYGTSTNSLDKTLTSLVNKKNHEFELTNLTPNTTYYFRVVGKTGSQTIYSDYFTFKTSKKTAVDNLDIASSLILESSNIVLLDPFRAKNSFPIAVVPLNTSFQLRFRTDPEAGIKKIQLFLKDKHVLGLTSTEKEEASGSNVNMVEVKRGEFTGRLFSGSKAGLYSLIARVEDSQGNISEKNLADVRVLPFMKVVTKDNKPIENARAYLSYFSESEKRFLNLSNQGLSIPNPYYSDINGEFKMTLPEGHYRAHISSIGFKGKEVDFIVGGTEKNIYPTVVLDAEPFSIFNTISYYYSTISDLIKSFTENVLPLSRSTRIVDLSGIVTLSILVLLSFAAFFRRTRFDLYSFGFFTLHHTPIIKKSVNLTVFSGQVIDSETLKPISKAVITILDDKRTVLQNIKTNAKGIFYCPYSPGHKIISVLKEGFLEHEKEIQPENKDSILIKLTKQKGYIGSYEKKLLRTPLYLFSFMLEGILILSFVVEFYLLFLWGPVKVLPFLILSIINLVLFSYYQSSHRRFDN